MLGIDLSNYSDIPTPDQLAAWKDVGVGLTIIQSLVPPAGYPHAGDATYARRQAQACLDAGLAVDAYAWLWFDDDPIADMQMRALLMAGLPIRQWWLDVEDTAARKYDQATTEAKVADALAVLDAAPSTSGERAGVYTARWYWPSVYYLADSTRFCDRELWDAAYDGQVTTEGFQPYGGWSRRALHQYAGTSTLAGVGNVDLNVLSDAEEREITQPPDPSPAPDPDYRVALASVTAPTGEIVPALDAAMRLTSAKAMRAAILPSRNRLVTVYDEFQP